MRIISIRHPQVPGADARFDVELSEHLRLFNLSLTKNTKGQWRTYAPRNRGVHFASFHPDLASKITAAAVAALEAAAHVGR